jgi:hypothetical protein
LVLISFCVFSFVWILCLKYLHSFRLLVSDLGCLLHCHWADVHRENDYF